MMPYCHYKRCKKVATEKFGQVNDGTVDGYGKEWLQTVYVCDKHFHKLLRLLGMKYEKGQL